MSKKYKNILLFLLFFIILCTISYFLYLKFNPIDNDTTKQSQATDLIYIFTGISTLLSPIVLIFSLDSWKSAFNAEKTDQLLTERIKICGLIKNYMAFDHQINLAMHQKAILDHISNFSNNSININEFYQRIDSSYFSIIRIIANFGNDLHINQLCLKNNISRNESKIQSEIINDLNNLANTYSSFKISILNNINTLQTLQNNFQNLSFWKELSDNNTKIKIIDNVEKLEKLSIKNI
ncbi:hypothetical protein [Acinetobacter sp. ANC 4640]